MTDFYLSRMIPREVAVADDEAEECHLPSTQANDEGQRPLSRQRLAPPLVGHPRNAPPTTHTKGHTYLGLNDITP
jgi:hypothetical protein